MALLFSSNKAMENLFPSYDKLEVQAGVSLTLHTLTLKLTKLTNASQENADMDTEITSFNNDYDNNIDEDYEELQLGEMKLFRYTDTDSVVGCFHDDIVVH